MWLILGVCVKGTLDVSPFDHLSPAFHLSPGHRTFASFVPAFPVLVAAASVASVALLQIVFPPVAVSQSVCVCVFVLNYTICH